MKSLQQVGTEILTNNPTKLYIFTGVEYGIKSAYIKSLHQYYGDVKEISRVADVVSLMSVKHLVPLKPCLYVVRYDEEFISTLSEVTANKLKSLNIAGTLVCIYSDAKHSAKLEKYLSDVTTSIDEIAPQFIYKYLKRDYPAVPDQILNSVIKYSTDYGQADIRCRVLSLLTSEELYSLTDADIVQLFGVLNDSSDSRFKRAVASRNFESCLHTLEDVSQYDNYLYSILSTMIELEKAVTNKYASSSLREFASRWTLTDIANMFEHTFQELLQLRQGVGDPQLSLIYLLSLTQFSTIPEWEK